MKRTTFALTISLAIVACPLIGLAEEMTGFQDFQFGMTRQAAEAVQPLTPGSSEESGRWYRAASMVNILGDDYSQELLFNPDDILIQVNVSRKFDGGDTACTSEFNAVFGAIRARYGEPDQPPNRSVHGGISAITAARFTGTDGSRVNLASIWLNDCTINVAYVSSPGGSGF